MGARAVIKKNVPDAQRRFLAELAKVGIIEIAAARSGMNKSRHYGWLDDPEYAKAYAEAQRMSDARLEAEVRRRGEEGVKRGVWHLGKQVGEETVYSDNLLMFYVKRRMPEYRDVSATNIAMTANVQSNVKLDLTKVSDADLEQTIATFEIAAGIARPDGALPGSTSGEDETDEK